MENKKVAVIMGSDSDLPVVQKAVNKLKSFGIATEVHVMSAHRTPAQACAFSANAKENGFGVIIAAAGKAAHLAGVLAAHTTLPVIGIPIKSSTLDGLDEMCIRDRSTTAEIASQWRREAISGTTPPYCLCSST